MLYLVWADVTSRCFSGSEEKSLEVACRSERKFTYHNWLNEIRNILTAQPAYWLHYKCCKKDCLFTVAVASELLHVLCCSRLQISGRSLAIMMYFSPISQIISKKVSVTLYFRISLFTTRPNIRQRLTVFVNNSQINNIVAIYLLGKTWRKRRRLGKMRTTFGLTFRVLVYK